MCTDSSFKQYLSEISKYPKLSTAEETEIAKKINEGDKQAFDYFVNCNLKTVVALVEKYFSGYKDKMDLIQAGNVGLINAAKKYTASNNTSFRSLLWFYVYKECYSHLRTMSFSVTMPSHLFEALQKIKTNNTLAELEFADMTDDEIEELANEFECSEKNLRSIMKIINSVCFDDVVQDEEWTTKNYSCKLGEEITGSNDFSIDSYLDFRHVFNTLTDREVKVLKMRNGLDGYPEMTLEEIGNEIGVHKERVRQIEAKALRKLRHPSRVRLYM